MARPTTEGAPPGEPTGFRVEELANRTGVPVRTIREYQTWQVLHPPTRVGRVGFYDDTHVQRLQAIARLQERGYSIAAIRDLFAAWEQGAGLRDVLGVTDTVDAPADEGAIALTASQLAELLPSITASPRLLARACSCGLLSRDRDGFVARSPALVQLVADAVSTGVPPSTALDLAGSVVAGATRVGSVAAGAVARSALADRDAVEPFVRRGRVLLARAVATHTIDQVGRHLAAHAATNPGLGELLADIRIGAAPQDRRPAAEPGRAPGTARRPGDTLA